MLRLIARAPDCDPVGRGGGKGAGNETRQVIMRMATAEWREAVNEEGRTQQEAVAILGTGRDS